MVHQSSLESVRTICYGTDIDVFINIHLEHAKVENFPRYHSKMFRIFKQHFEALRLFNVLLQLKKGIVFS